MFEIKPIDKEIVERLLKLIDGATIIDGSPIEPDKVTSIAIRQNSVVMMSEVEPWGTIIYSTTAAWDFFVNALKTFIRNDHE